MASLELWREGENNSQVGSKVRVARLAARQHGRVTDAQIRALGIAGHVVRYWRETSYLHRTLPRVFAVGSGDRTYESDLFEAILYAGPGAMLGHMSSAHWRELIDHPPPVIQVSTPRRVASLPGLVEVHDRRRLPRVWHRGIPVTTVAQTMLDLAATRRTDPVLVRKGLARLDYRRQLDLAALQSIRKRGRAGSAPLGRALADHDPRFAHTLSPSEDDWIVFCERTGTPKPDAINERIHGVLCDVVYRDARVIVELDGAGNHHSAAQIRRDRANDRLLRGHGWLVLRYTWHDVHGDPLGVHDDVLAVLRARTQERPDD
jgi:hypothetical protein